jgi:hypothetical protein
MSNAPFASADRARGAQASSVTFCRRLLLGLGLLVMASASLACTITSGETGDASVADSATHGQHEAAPADVTSDDASGGGSDGAPDGGQVGAESGPADGGFVPASHLAFPQIPDLGGPVLSPMTLVTIVASNDSLAAQLQPFGDALVASSWWQAIGADYGVGAGASSVHVTGPAITSDQNQASLVAYIQGTIADAGSPPPNGNTMYLVYLPDGVNLSDQPKCAYHHPFPDPASTVGDGWGAVARCAAVSQGETPIDEATRLASHEVAEAATDPTIRTYSLGGPGASPWTGSIWQAWYTGDIETADLCIGTRFIDTTSTATYEYQRSWSNSAAAAGGDPCVPGLGQPYYSASPSQEWYAIAAGQTVSIPVTGWSTSATQDWLVEPYLANASPRFAGLKTDPPGAGGGLSVTGGLGVATKAPCYPRVGINNGVQATVQVTAPAAVQSGDFATLQIMSYRNAPSSCNPPLTSDLFHFMLVGVYVP